MEITLIEFFQQNEWAFDAFMWMVVFTPILVIIIITIWWGKRKKRKARQRAQAMQRYASLNGYYYYPVVYNLYHYNNEKDPQLKKEYKVELEIQHEVDDLYQLKMPHQDLMEFSHDLALFGAGHLYNKIARNILEKNERGLIFLIFDYSYDMSGKYTTLYTQTVVRFHSAQRNWPVFGIRPEGVLDRLGAALGDMDVDFDEYPVFSRQYAVIGNTDDEIRKFLTPDRIQFFEELASRGLGLTVEGAGPDFLVYRHNTLVETGDLDAFLQQAREIYGALS